MHSVVPERPSLRWPQQRGQSSEPLIIAGLLALEVLVITAFAIWPPAGARHGLEPVVIAVVTGAGVAAMAVDRHRPSPRALEVLVAIAWIVPVVITSSRLLEASQVLWGMVVMPVAVTAAYTLPARGAIRQVLTMAVLYALAASVVAPLLRPLYLAAILVCLLASATAIGLTRRERDLALSALEAMATTDALTGLLNRRGLSAEAHRVRANAVRSGQPTTVAVFDIDGLKHFNDRVGHEAGDRLIADTARHWREHVRAGDVLARVGGDEFVVVLPNADVHVAGHLLRRIRKASHLPWSQGLAVWEPGESLDQALRRADAQMYAEKALRARARTQ